METYSLLVVLLLASLGFLAFAAKVALVTEIAFLLVVAYLAVFVALAALLAVAVCRVVSLYDKIAQGERHLNSCQTDASAKQQSAASRIDALERDIAEKKEAFAKVWHDRNSRSQEISALKKTHSQEIARLQAILVKVKSESVDSSEVEIAKRIERQWSLLRHVLVKGGIKATTEQEWLDAVTELVQRKPSNSTPIGVVSEDLETARAQLAKEISEKETAERKATRLEASLRVARLDVDILKNQLQETEATNNSKQRHTDLQRQQLDAEQQKEWGGKEKTSKLQRRLAEVWQQLKKEQSRFQEATEKFQAEKRTTDQRDKVIESLRSDIHHTNTQKTELQKKLDDFEATEKQKEKDTDQAQSKIKEQETEISELKRRLAKETEEKVTLTTDLENSRVALSSTQDSLKSTQDTLASTQDTLKFTETRLGELDQNASRHLEARILEIKNEIKNEAEDAHAARIAQIKQEYEDQATTSTAKIAQLESTISIKDDLMVQYEVEKQQLEQQLNNALQPLGNANTALPTQNDPTRWTPQSFAQFMENPAQIDPQLLNLNSNFTQDEIDQAISSSVPQPDFSNFINDDFTAGFDHQSSSDSLDASDSGFGALVAFNNSTPWPQQGPSVQSMPQLDSTAQLSQDTSQYEDFSQFLPNDDMTNTTLVNDEFVYNDPNFQPYSMEELTATPQDLPTYTTHESEYDTANNNNDQGNSSYALPEPQGRKRRAS